MTAGSPVAPGSRSYAPEETVTGEGVALELPVASLGMRALSGMIDVIFHIGLLIGALLVLLALPHVSRLLPDGEGLSPAILASAALVLILVALVANLLPARKVINVEVARSPALIPLLGKMKGGLQGGHLLFLRFPLFPRFLHCDEGILDFPERIHDRLFILKRGLLGFEFIDADLIAQRRRVQQWSGQRRADILNKQRTEGSAVEICVGSAQRSA